MKLKINYIEQNDVSHHAMHNTKFYPKGKSKTIHENRKRNHKKESQLLKYIKKNENKPLKPPDVISRFLIKFSKKKYWRGKKQNEFIAFEVDGRDLVAIRVSLPPGEYWYEVGRLKNCL